MNSPSLIESRAATAWLVVYLVAVVLILGALL